MAETPVIPLDQVQGLVRTGWGTKHRFAGYLFVHLGHRPDAARAWLRAVTAQVAWADRAFADAPLRVQVAITVDGARALGAPAEALDGFPQEAKLGMSARARTLGDDGANAPSEWRLWPPGAPVHALVILMTSSEASRTALLVEHLALLDEHGGAMIAWEPSAEWRSREPFGFRDGVSQPELAGVPGNPERPPPATPRNQIRAGEILLGYPNEYGRKPQMPRYPDGFPLGENGTYLVFRKLEQDVVGFWRYFRDQATRLRGEKPVPDDVIDATHWLAARAMGRWPNGASLIRQPSRPGDDDRPGADVNDFGYGADPHGTGCPIGSHVRRANPRDGRDGTPDESFLVVNRHRILRRGRAFGPPLAIDAAIAGDDDGARRGLLFVSLQASIARGFEFIQQTWNVNPGFHGLSGEPDPITGPGGRPFTIPHDPVRLRLHGVPRFVTCKGGGYLFLPSRAALERLSRP